MVNVSRLLIRKAAREKMDEPWEGAPSNFKKGVKISTVSRSGVQYST